MPDIVLNKLFNLILPGGLQHDFLDGLHSDHQSVHVLDQDVISRDKKLLTAALASLTTD